mmetsp:Transcript_8938/g.16275  ORF Transcript_8938/g.16275 Transcript_8938/m.16275 type:complete len:386 (-) Transcript_8938:47-1204(-)
MVAPRAIVRLLLFLFLAADHVECFLSSRRHSLCHDRFSLHAIVEDSAVTALVEEQSEVIPNVFTAPSLGLNNNWFPKQKSTIQTESTTDDFAKDTTCPFVIDQLEKTSPETTFRRIAQMCIEVFFNANDDEEYSENRDIPPWKRLQLSYLRNTQYSDLRSRKFFSGAQNDMFVARRVVVVPASSALILSSPPIVDMSIIYNREGLPKRPQDNDLEFIRGDVIGFCEVSERPFGLGKNFDEQSDDGGYRERKRPMRPLLTNLSVRPDVRKSGLGSQLVRVCEDAVLQWDPAYDEIVLQVEDDNPLALQFYEKRGYASLFADPSCRRFDTSGIFLQQVRTTKICMRKSLRRGPIGNRNGNGSLGSFFSNGSSLFDKLRDSILKMSDL